MFVKNLVREAAGEGSLKMIVPLGADVVNGLTRGRIEEVIGTTSSTCTVTETFPAPNAKIPGGYEIWYKKLDGLRGNK